MELLKSGCIECSTTKSTTVSLASFCGECGLDRTEITYEIPSEILDEVLRDILVILDFHRLRPLSFDQAIPTYDYLLRRLEV